MTKLSPPPIAKGKCPKCGGDLQLDYKNVQHQAKCINCHRWLIITRAQYRQWKAETENQKGATTCPEGKAPIPKTQPCSMP